MTEAQRQLVKAFIENEAMAEAVRATVYTGIEQHGLRAILTLDRILPNEIYGQRVKSITEAISLVELSFAQLKQIASSKDGVQSVKNEAR